MAFNEWHDRRAEGQEHLEIEGSGQAGDHILRVHALVRLRGIVHRRVAFLALIVAGIDSLRRRQLAPAR